MNINKLKLYDEVTLKNAINNINITNIDNIDNEGNTLLYHACRKNFKNIIKFLLEKGANPNISNNEGNTPLHIVMDLRCNIIDIIKILIKYGANINTINKAGSNPFNYYCILHHHDFKLGKYLIEKGADINNISLNGYSPLFSVCYYGNEQSEDIALYLIKNNADVNFIDKNNNSILHIASKICTDKVIKSLLNKNALCNTLDSDLRTPIFYAYGAENIKLFIKKGANIDILDKNGLNILEYSLMTKYQITPQYLSLLVNEHNNKTLLNYFCKYRINILKEYLDYLLDGFIKYKKDLNIVIKREFNNIIECLQFLILKKSDINYKDIDDHTPLDYIINNDNYNNYNNKLYKKYIEKITKLLIKNSAKISLSN